MNLSGNLSDVSIEELLQFLRHGQRSGMLALRRGEQKAAVALRDGEPVSVQMPGIPRLGDLLLDSGLSDPITVREAARVQAEEEVRRPLGQILVAQGAIDRQRLKTLIEQQLDLALARLPEWARDGSYTFFAGEPTPDNDLSLDLGEPRRPTSEWSALVQQDREVLHAIARATLQDSEDEDTAVAVRADRTSVQVLTSDSMLFDQVAALLPRDLQPPQRLAAIEEAFHGDGEPSTVIVVDLRAKDSGHDLLRAARRERPACPLVAVIDADGSPSQAFSSGAVSVAPAEAMALSTCIINLAEMLAGVWRQAASQQARSKPPGNAAAAVVHDPNETTDGGEPSTIETARRDQDLAIKPDIAALDLMQSISSMTERAILFERNGDRLESAGAFGWSADGRPLAEVTRGLTLEIEAAGILARCLSDGEPSRVTLGAATLPEVLLRRIGPPASGEIVILPVAAPNGRVLSIFYADNGAIDAPLASLDALLAVAAELAPAAPASLKRPISHAG
jgi:hypothetical protein